MENLTHFPKEQVEEVLSLVSELMPLLSKGVSCIFVTHGMSG